MFKYLEFNRCKIRITDAESLFLENNILNKSSRKDVKNAIIKLYYNSDKRYFQKYHINEITENLFLKINKELISEVGRNLSNYNKMSGDNSANITDSEVLRYNDIVSAEVGVDAENGKDILTLVDNKGVKTIKYFDSPASANLYISNLRINNL